MADLTKWSPFDKGRSPLEVFEPLRRFLEGDLESSAIRVEELVDANTFVVRAELPGIDPDKDVDVSIVNGSLQIQVVREENTEQRDLNRYRSEFRYGSFVRTVQLPEGVTEQDITASYKDGVLEVRAPLPAQTLTSRPTKIQINRS